MRGLPVLRLGGLLWMCGRPRNNQLQLSFANRAARYFCSRPIFTLKSCDGIDVFAYPRRKPLEEYGRASDFIYFESTRTPRKVIGAGSRVARAINLMLADSLCCRLG